MYEYIPSAVYPTHDELQAYVRGLDGCGPATELAPFAEGAHNFVYRGRNGPAGFEDFVLRHAKHPAHDAMLLKEARALTLVADQAPRVWKYGRLVSGASVLLQEYIPGQPQSFSTLTNVQIGSLATALSNVHAIVSNRFSGRSGEAPNCCGGTYQDYVWAMVHESVHARLCRFNVRCYPEAIELLGDSTHLLSNLLADQKEHFQEPDKPFSLQHHDCSEGNVLWCDNGTLKLIDWNPTFGDPADELAYVFTDNHCSQAFIKTFLQTYQPPQGSGEIVSRLPVYVLKNLLDDVAWTIEMRELHPAEEQWIAAYEQRFVALSSYSQSYGAPSLLNAAL